MSWPYAQLRAGNPVLNDGWRIPTRSQSHRSKTEPWSDFSVDRCCQFPALLRFASDSGINSQPSLLLLRTDLEAAEIAGMASGFGPLTNGGGKPLTFLAGSALFERPELLLHSRIGKQILASDLLAFGCPANQYGNVRIEVRYCFRFSSWHNSLFQTWFKGRNPYG